MNIEEFPEEIKKDIEDRSLDLLDGLKDDVMVIGGWAVRALTKDAHKRYTLDVDGVCHPLKLASIKGRMVDAGMTPRDTKWGFQFYVGYVPPLNIEDPALLARLKTVELRIEISGPKIQEYDSHHYFEFDLEDRVLAKIPYHNKSGSIHIVAPSLEQMAAVKLGLPVDFKNNYDSAVLLHGCDIEKVIAMIKKNDDWGEMVLRRMPKLRSRVKDRNRLEFALLVNSGIDIKAYVKALDMIEHALKIK